VGVGAARLVAEDVGDAYVGGEVGATDEGGAGTGVGTLVLGAAEAEFEEEGAAAVIFDEGGLGGDEDGVVEVVEEGGFEDLGHGEGALDDGERLVGVDHAALGDGAHAEAVEVAIVA
jgi:hypothetical protein